MSVVANVAINVDAKGAAQELNKVDTAAKGLSGSFGALQAAVAALGLGLAIKSIADVGNQSEASKIKLQALTAQYGELNQAGASVDRIQKLLGISAIDARDSYAQLYGSLRGTGLSAQQLEVLFVGLNKAAKLSGGGAQEAQAGIMQLKQAFSSGALSGDELRSVLENMPAFAQAVGRETDKLGLTSNATAADLKRLGAEGKLTSNILFEAAKSLANSQAPGITAAEKLNTAFKNLQEKIAEAFGPSVTALVERFSATITVVGNWFTNNKESISAVAKAFLNLATSVGPLAIGILAVVKAYQAWQIISKAVAATQAFLMALTGPKGLALVAGAAIAAGVAYTALNGILAGTDEELKKQQLEAKKAGDEFKNITNNVAPLPSKVQETADKTKFLADGFRQAALEATKGQLAIQAQIASLDRGATVTAARYEAEKALSDLSLQQLNRQYELATTAERRLELARLIFEEQVNAAKIEYNQALEAITLGERKIELEGKLAELKYKEIQAEGELQILKAKDITAANEKRAQLEKALAAQNEVIKATKETGVAEQQVNEYKKITAETQYKSKVLTAQIALEQKLVSKEIGLSQQQAQSLSDKLGSSVTNAKNLVSSTQQISSAANAAANGYINLEKSAINAANAINNATNAQIRQNSTPKGGGGGGARTTTTTTNNNTRENENSPFLVKDKFAEIAKTPGDYGSSSLNMEGNTNPFNSSLNMEADYRKGKDYLGLAKGGVVNGPTLAMVGEGGEREYIIPESKMGRASANYMSGARGGAVIPAFANGGVVGSSRTLQGRNSTTTIKPQISIQTGPVMQMNGTNYVTMQDLGRAVQTGVRQTLNIIQGDMNMRNQMGLS